VSERYEQHIEFSDRFDSVNEQILVVVYDTLREVTTITFLTNTQGDTLRTDRITDRQTNEVIVKTEKLSVVTNQAQTVNDTLLIADTVIASESEAIHTSPSLRGAEHCEATKQSTCRRTLFWIFAIIVALAVLVYLIKIKK
jgi:hypothetical protein